MRALFDPFTDTFVLMQLNQDRTVIEPRTRTKYLYDGNGLRVAKKSGANSDCSGGTVVKLYWRSVSGDAIAETDATGSTTNAAYSEYVFFSGRRIASRSGTGAIFYFFADQLGTTRTITTGNGPGQTPGQLCWDQDYTPYGQELFTSAQMSRLQTTACPPNYRFTGYEYDSETGLSYAFARYYSPLLGRFLSTDPLGGSVGDLQSHNAYAYVLNNPANLVDPLGLNGCNKAQFRSTEAYNAFCGGGAGGGGGGAGCTLDGVYIPCDMLGRLGQQGAVIAVSSLAVFRSGSWQIWIPGGYVATRVCIFQADGSPACGPIQSGTGYAGRWETIPVASYYPEEPVGGFYFGGFGGPYAQGSGAGSKIRTYDPWDVQACTDAKAGGFINAFSYRSMMPGNPALKEYVTEGVKISTEKAVAVKALEQAGEFGELAARRIETHAGEVALGVGTFATALDAANGASCAQEFGNSVRSPFNVLSRVGPQPW